jgi:hypothetical protein
MSLMDCINHFYTYLVKLFQTKLLESLLGIFLPKEVFNCRCQKSDSSFFFTSFLAYQFYYLPKSKEEIRKTDMHLPVVIFESRTIKLSYVLLFISQNVH